MTRDKHLDFIDQLRGIAILLVVLAHVLPYAGVVFPAPFASGSPSRSFGALSGFITTSLFCNGYLGVLLFFVLSGFCIRWSHLHTREFSWRDFYLRRTFRIYPAYLVWLAIFAVLAAAPLHDVALHALMYHNLSATSFLSINPPFWSIALEWQIYLLYPLIVLISSRLDRKSVLIAAAMLGLGSSVLATTTAREAFHSDLPLVISQLPFSLLFPWMIGFYQADALHSDAPPLTCDWKCRIAMIATAVLIESCPKIHVMRLVAWSFVASMILDYWRTHADRLISRPFAVLSFIGVISYSIYLGHDLVARFYPSIERALSLPRASLLAGLLACLLCLPFFILIGWVSYQIFEKPGIRIGSHLRLKR